MVVKHELLSTPGDKEANTQRVLASLVARLVSFAFSHGENYGVAGALPGQQQSTGLLHFILRAPGDKEANTQRVLASLVARQGLEPWTHALKGRCSTN